MLLIFALIRSKVRNAVPRAVLINLLRSEEELYWINYFCRSCHPISSLLPLRIEKYNPAVNIESVKINTSLIMIDDVRM